MTPQTSDKLFFAISTLVREVENELEYTLQEEDYRFLMTSYMRRIPNSVYKFVKGGKEHNPDHDRPFVSSCPVVTEIENEVIDLQHYVDAAIESIRNGRK